MQIIILRGIPGSGKSTLAKDRFSGATIVSADDFFMEGGEYRFDGENIGEAHKRCWKMFYEAVLRHDPLIVVDNTNISAADIAPYVLPAEVHGYVVNIITLRVDPAVAAARNVHRVSLAAVQRIARNLDKETARMPRRWKHEVVEGR
jgi:predicted kinase